MSLEEREGASSQCFGYPFFLRSGKEAGIFNDSGGAVDGTGRGGGIPTFGREFLTI